ncbi:MAG: long-chain fatty acid--CoA ligase, partial [Candidatus Methylomirabilis sp.]|nr:long-chain fatty acid--CoA ligase [Deltaproteobacteria bacterium]
GTWREFGEAVEEVALGLTCIGVEPLKTVNILSSSRREWVIADQAILAAGAITVPIYPTVLAPEVEYIVNNCEAEYIFVENAEQLKKFRETKTGIKKIVLIEGGAGADSDVITLADLRSLGKTQGDRGALQARIDGTKPDQLATFVYTSGTTGFPKGVMQTHGNHVATCKAAIEMKLAGPDDRDMLFLPLAHSFARMEEFAAIALGMETAFARGIDTVAADLQETKPTVVYSVPRIYEKIYAKILAGAEAGSPLKKKIFDWAVSVGKEISAAKQANPKSPRIGGLLKLKGAIATKLVFGKLQTIVGGRLRYFVSGGAPLSREIAEFFHAAGIQILEGYGLTETCPALTFNRLDNYKFGTVGQPIPGVEVKIAEDGEILGKGPNISLGYYKREPETKEVYLEGGWFATGDIGEFDKDGFLRITDRKKDLFKTSAGKYIAPQKIENLLKTEKHISQAMATGDNKNYITALITLDEDAMKEWCKAEGRPWEGVAKLVGDPKLIETLQKEIENTNTKLASYETVKKFRIAPKDFSVEGGELTPTLKVKRKVVVKMYQDLIDSMYAEGKKG